MKRTIFIIPFIVLACSQQEEQPKNDLKNDLLELINNDQDPVCPQGHHKDSIVPIEYGFPSEEMFQQADSGLIVLGGCELGDHNYYCKRHAISF